MTTLFSATFRALENEAQFTKEMLGSGATQIRNANYAAKGAYFQAFTSLSTGLERIGKLCLMLDYYIETKGQFPEANFLKNKIGHNILLIYEKSRLVVDNRSISFSFLSSLDQSLHQSILTVLSGFAEGDRYSNINLLVGGKNSGDSIANWFQQVDEVIFDSRVTAARKAKILRNAHIIEDILVNFTSACHTSETGSDITSVQEASYRTGMYEVVAPYRQLLVLQIIRYWVEILSDLQYKAMEVGKHEIPFFSELFGLFYNDDAYIKTRKTWDKL